MKSKTLRPPSIRQIAQSLGLSKSAVSLALNSTPENCLLADSTRTRILAEAERLGYRSNSIAQAMRTGRFNSIGLVSDERDPLYLPAEMVSGISHRLERHGVHLIVAWMSEAALGEKGRLPSVLEFLCSDGLLLHYTQQQPQVQHLVEQYRIPSIWLNAKLAHDCAYMDDYGGSREITDRLIELGHRNIGFIGFPDFEHYSATDRVAGFRSAMGAAGLDPCVFTAPSTVLKTDEEFDHRVSWVEQFLARKDRPSAVVCYEIDIAGPLVTAALRRGLRIPGDISIATFARLARNHTGVPITTLKLSLHELGQVAADAVMRKIENPRSLIPAIVLPVSWRSEVTIGPPAEDSYR